METLWLIPVHVRPVVSFDALQKGRSGDPVSGLDRFNLTDIGELILNRFRKEEADIIFKGVDLPFPWEMVFKIDNDPKASLRGMKVGPSTYRSIFKLMFFDGDDVKSIIRDCLDELERDPLDSPYWDDATWQEFQKAYRSSRDAVIDSNFHVIAKL